MTKVLFSEIFKKITINPHSFARLLEILPKRIFLAYSIQYRNLAKEIKIELDKKGYKIDGFQQVLGCSIIKPQDTVLLVGEERFHALNLLKFSKKVLVFDGSKSLELSEDEKNLFEKREKAKLSKFLYSDNIGLLVSTKNKSDLKKAIKINSLLSKKYPNKKFQIFLFDTLNHAELENFQIDIWINLACPGIEYDSNKILNIDSLKI